MSGLATSEQTVLPEGRGGPKYFDRLGTVRSQAFRKQVPASLELAIPKLNSQFPTKRELNSIGTV